MGSGQLVAEGTDQALDHSGDLTALVNPSITRRFGKESCFRSDDRLRAKLATRASRVIQELNFVRRCLAFGSFRNVRWNRKAGTRDLVPEPKVFARSKREVSLRTQCN